MISKNKIKYIHSLELKKNRNKEGVFVAEGHKVVEDLLELQPAGNPHLPFYHRIVAALYRRLYSGKALSQTDKKHRERG